MGGFNVTVVSIVAAVVASALTPSVVGGGKGVDETTRAVSVREVVAVPAARAVTVATADCESQPALANITAPNKRGKTFERRFIKTPFLSVPEKDFQKILTLTWPNLGEVIDECREITLMISLPCDHRTMYNLSEILLLE
jgi:hypothetical protein